MNLLTIIFTCAALLVAGTMGITLSVPLQAPAVILLGIAALFAAAQVLKSGSAAVQDCGRKGYRNCWLWVSLIAIFYFVGRAWLSPVWGLGVEDLMLILPAGILYLVAGHAMGGQPGVRLRLGLAWIVILLLLFHIVSCIHQWQGDDGYSLTTP